MPNIGLHVGLYYITYKNVNYILLFTIMIVIVLVTMQLLFSWQDLYPIPTHIGLLYMYFEKFPEAAFSVKKGINRLMRNVPYMKHGYLYFHFPFYKASMRLWPFFSTFLRDNEQNLLFVQIFRFKFFTSNLWRLFKIHIFQDGDWWQKHEEKVSKSFIFIQVFIVEHR